MGGSAILSEKFDFGGDALPDLAGSDGLMCSRLGGGDARIWPVWTGLGEGWFGWGIGREMDRRGRGATWWKGGGEGPDGCVPNAMA